jgi:fatty acid desaturase
VAAFGHADYVKALRPHLPRDAFRPDPRAYVRIAVHLGVIFAGFAAFRVSPKALWPLISLGIAGSTSALPFLAHDLSHRSIVTHRFLLYPTELALWSLLFVPVTLWRRLHNAHHVHANSEDDPDRAYLTTDLGLVALVTSALLHPNRIIRYNPLCLLYFVAYPLRHIAALFFSNSPSFVTAKPKSSARDTIRMLLEIVFIVTLQGLIAVFVTGAYIWASLVPVLIASAVSSCYFFTNHRLQKFHDSDDVLASTTSVAVPGVCDFLHSNFSYHTEHHLFPAMNSKYYPTVGQLLKVHFPDRYHRLPIGAAWSELWANPILLPPDDEHAGVSAAEEAPGKSATSNHAQSDVAVVHLTVNALRLPVLRRVSK